MADDLAHEILELVRDMDARTTALAADLAELKEIVGRVEARMAECLAVARRAAGQPEPIDEARRLH